MCTYRAGGLLLAGEVISYCGRWGNKCTYADKDDLGQYLYHLCGGKLYRRIRVELAMSSSCIYVLRPNQGRIIQHGCLTMRC